MANHSINIRLSGNGSGGSGKPTSSLTQFQKKSANISSPIKKQKSSIAPILGAIASKIPVLAAIQAVAKTVQAGVNLAATIQSAKTGEAMKANNLKKEASAIVNPLSYAKSAIWENGVLRNMELARENQSLEYRRQLTGDLIYSKNTQNTIV